MIANRTVTRLLAVISLAVVLASACSGSESDEADSDDGGRTTEQPTTSSTPPSTAPDDPADGTEQPADGSDVRPDGSILRGQELAERLADLEGQLALGNGPAIAVARPDGEALQVIGEEAETSAQPTWSNEGTSLAWSSVSPGRQAVLVQGFDEEGQLDGDPQVSEAEGFPIFYLQWSEDDGSLAFLRSASTPGQVEFGFAQPGRPAEPAASDSPFFISWSPGSDRVLAHVGQRTVELHDPSATDDDPVEVLAQGDDYSAPVWIDDDRAMVVADDALAIVTVDDGAIEPLEPVDGPLRFVLSPDRRRVAFRLLTSRSEGPLTAGFGNASSEDGASSSEDGAASSEDEVGLVVLDLVTGLREVIADDTVAAWDWSPDGSRLAWLSLPIGGPRIGHWNFWSVDGSDLAVSRTPDFGLSRKYAEVYLPFFAQYAQSVTGWAPDSSAFAFAGNVGGERGVWIQLIDDIAEAQQVATGDVVTWGPGPTPNPGGGASAA